MEKLSKNIHNHTFTDLLKVCVFALLLLLPGIMFLPSCLYYGFNEHATNTETTTITYKYESNEVNGYGDLETGNIYQFNTAYKSINDMNITSYIRLQILTDLEFDLEYVTFDDYAFDKLILPLGSYLEIADDSYFYVYQDYDFQYQIFDFSYTDEFVNNCYVIYIDGECDYTMFSYTDYNVIESVSVNTDDTISTKLYRSWEQMWNTHLFSWTNNTPLNTGINGFIGVFGINSQSYLGNCLIWLLSITAIYVVIDIVIGVFKWLTHLIGNH